MTIILFFVNSFLLVAATAQLVNYCSAVIGALTPPQLNVSKFKLFLISFGQNSVELASNSDLTACSKVRQLVGPYVAALMKNTQKVN